MSQQQLAIKLRVEPEENPGFLTWERRRLLIHAAKTALAAGAVLVDRHALWAARRLLGRDQRHHRAAIELGATISASRDRILGTLIGALLGFSFSQFGALPWNYILAVLAAVIVCGLLGLRSSSRLAGVTITIVMLVHKDGSHWTLALDRVMEVLLGHRGGAR